MNDVIETREVNGIWVEDPEPETPEESEHWKQFEIFVAGALVVLSALIVWDLVKDK